MAELAMETGMVWPLAVRSTVSRASGAECVGSKALRCTSSMKPSKRLADQFIRGIAQQQLRGLIAALDDAVRRGDEHRVAQAVEHGIEVVLGDGRFVQVLPHALERELQIAEFVAAHARRAAGCSRRRRFDRRSSPARRSGPESLAGDEPGAQQPQDKQRHA